MVEIKLSPGLYRSCLEQLGIVFHPYVAVAFRERLHADVVDWLLKRESIKPECFYDSSVLW